ncbi:tRNA (N6-isopentenyl adenosine(37)-C2)-methylthiotransferase MiaB [Candidatus Poribacteria bacterium]|nr:tRNA (N6-isopentenyl adenosine(37)-C2)-methylthiotransferase MiaB [Candidatus Poribacteria bacterium]
MTEKFYIITHGCQMNKCDSELLASILTEHGYTSTDEVDDADVILINTCSVRDTAERKILGRLERFKAVKQERPELILGVCGCMAQSWGKELMDKYPHVDIILGTGRLSELPRLIRKCRELGKSAVDISEEPSEIEIDNTMRESSVTAWVNIMYGCNNFCSYCIVPYVRGRERSRSSGSILQEIKKLDESGYREVTLLGQNVNSYGLDTGENVDFADLLVMVDRETHNIKRIRFTTSHPKDVPQKLINALGDLPKICNNFHLPAQAGSNKILKLMNRGYTREYYFKLVDKLRDKVPDIAITTDLIVGFPGETEEDFQDTLDLVQRVQFDVGFCFRYSPRRDTPAATMEGQLPEEVKMRRLHELLEIQDEISVAKNAAYVGTVHEVLVEKVNPRDDLQISGRTSTNKIVFFNGSEELIGHFVNVRIVGSGNWSLRGEMIKEGENADLYEKV